MTGTQRLVFLLGVVSAFRKEADTVSPKQIRVVSKEIIDEITAAVAEIEGLVGN